MGLEIENISELRELLEAIREEEADPQIRKEKLAHSERVKERELAHREKILAVRHEQRLRAFAVGQEDHTTILARLHTANQVACRVPLIMGVIALLATWLVVKLTDAPSTRDALWAVWSACGLVSSVAVLGSFWSTRSGANRRQASIEAVTDPGPSKAPGGKQAAAKP